MTIPTGWEEVPIADIATEIRNSIRPVAGKRYELWSVPSYMTGGPEILDGSKIGSAKLEVQPWDVLVCKINPRINRVWIVRESSLKLPQIASPEWLVLRFPLSTRSIVAPSIASYLAGPKFRHWITGAVSGVTGSHTRAKSKEILQQKVPLPPLAEQQRIVASLDGYLSRLDAAVSSTKHAAQLCEHLFQLVVDAELERLADHVTTPLRQLLREPLRNGHSARATDDSAGVRTLTLSAVTRGMFTEEYTKVTSADPEKVKNLWLEAGDILIERSNTPDLVGTSALYDGLDSWAIFPDLLIRVRVNDEVLPEYAILALSASRVRAFYRRSAKGLSGSMPKIDQGVIESTRIPVPSKEEQWRIVTDVASRRSEISRINQVVHSSRFRAHQLRDALFLSAFSGGLAPQNPADEPASALLERMRAERLPVKRRKRSSKTAAVQEEKIEL